MKIADPDYTLVSSELHKDYSKEYFVTDLPALEPSTILLCLWPVTLAHWLCYIRPKYNFIAQSWYEKRHGDNKKAEYFM